jgi:Zn-dependent peptidase ImmA (M78 family)
MSEPRPVREGREKAEAVRFELGLGEAPIRDLFGFIERNYAVLVVRRPMPDGPEGALIRIGQRSLIVVNTSDCHLVRQRFTAAHELGHLVFDSASDPIQCDESLSEVNTPVEMRANAFAVHLLLPSAVLRLRFLQPDFNLLNDENIVSLAMEYGISGQSLSWHMKNVLSLTESQRQQIGSIHEPFKIAIRLGMTDRVRQEKEAMGAVGWPRKYVSMAAKAYESGRLDKASLGEILEDERLVSAVVNNLAPVSAAAAGSR